MSSKLYLNLLIKILCCIPTIIRNKSSNFMFHTLELWTILTPTHWRSTVKHCHVNLKRWLNRHHHEQMAPYYPPRPFQARPCGDDAPYCDWLTLCAQNDVSGAIKMRNSNQKLTVSKHRSSRSVASCARQAVHRWFVHQMIGLTWLASSISQFQNSQ